MDTEAVIIQKIPYSMFYLVPIADTHLGAKESSLPVIQGYIDWIRDHNNAYTILNGDLMNCAGKDTSPELFDDLVTPDMAYAKLRDIFMPIKDKILAISRGGHEEAIYRKVGADYSARLAYDLGNIPYRPDGGMLGIQTTEEGRKSNFIFWVYFTHGWGGARSIGAKVNKAQDLASIAEADIHVLSHDHTQAITRQNILYPSTRKTKDGYYHLIPHRKIFINTGGFLKYGGYVARKGYVPQDLGTPRIRCEVKRKGSRRYKDIHASL